MFTSRAGLVNSSARLPLGEYKYYKLEDAPLPSDTECSRDDALKFLTDMFRIRRFETSASNMFKEKVIRGFLHLYNGQEAVVVGIEAGIAKGDILITSYRCHAMTYTRGITAHAMLAELAGKVTGCSKGKGGSMHMYADDFFGGNGIVGAQVPLGVGAALAIKHRQQSNVSVVMYGDGAANQGQVFEAYNIAKLWNLPVIFVCENNKYGMGTAAHRSSASTEYYKRAGYIPGLHVDGMDVLSVREAIRYSRNWCVSGKGPILLEIESYRYFGHSMSDPGTSYRTREEVQAMRSAKDPIRLLASKVVEAGLVSDDEVQKLEKEARRLTDLDVEQCRKDADPKIDDAYDHVFLKAPANFTVRGCDVSIRKPQLN